MVIKRKDTNGRLRYQARVGNRSLGTFDTLKEARAAEARDRLAKRRPDTGVTVEHLVARYMDLWERGKLGKVPASSTFLTRRAQAAHLNKFFAGRRASTLTPVDAEDFADLHPSAVITASAIFNYAVDRRLADSNHFAAHVPEKGPGRADEDPLTDAEVERLGDIASEAFGIRMGALIPFLAFTGLRPHECYALDWPDIDWDSDEVWVRDGKTGPRHALMLPKARAAIEPFRGIGPIFATPTRGRRLTRQTMSGTYVPSIRKKFKRDFDLYDLRHYNAHLLYVRMGVESPIVAAHLGNSPSLVERVYGHHKVGALDRLREAVKRGVPDDARTSLADTRTETA